MERVLILGGGVGGTLVANLLARRLRSATDRRLLDITVVDATGTHVHGPALLGVALPGSGSAAAARPARRLLDIDVNLIVAHAERIDTAGRTVRLAGGAVLPYDYLVIATGCRLAPEAIAGLEPEAHHFHTPEAARELRLALDRFEGGRIVVGIASLPYKGPPAPLEAAFLVEAELRARKLRDRTELTYVSPMARPVPPARLADVATPLLAARSIAFQGGVEIRRLDATRHVLIGRDGIELPYDLLILVPPVRGQQVVVDARLAPGPGGWLPTHRRTLHVAGHREIFALGDATDMDAAKGGATAAFEARVVAEGLVAALVGRDPGGRDAVYDGSSAAFLEVGDGRAAFIRAGDAHATPEGDAGPSPLWHYARIAFNRTYFHTIPRGRLGT